MNNVDPSDPYGGPVWGMQSGDIGSTYEYTAPPMMLAGQAQMPESWTGQASNGAPVVVQPNSGNFQYIPQPHARARRVGLAGQAQMPESWTGQASNGAPVVVQPNSGNFQYIPQPHANKKGDTAQSKMQKLWMFNMGYEHHEQPPIYFGSARKENTAAESMAVKPTAAREMQLWGFPKQMMAQAQMPESWTQQGPQGSPVVVQPNSGNFQYIPQPHANKKGDTTKSKMQKLWMFNMGYEHHEQPPIYFGSARKEDNVAASM